MTCVIDYHYVSELYRFISVYINLLYKVVKVCHNRDLLVKHIIGIYRLMT